MAQENHDKLLTNIALIVAGYIIVKPMLENIGLLKNAQQKTDEALVTNVSSGNYWSPNFYSQYNQPSEKVKKLITQAGATKVAKMINDAWGIINDNEQQIYAAFRMLKNKLQVSQVVEKYALLYKQDLLTRLKTPWYYAADGLDDKEFAEVAKIVNALPVNLY